MEASLIVTNSDKLAIRLPRPLYPHLNYAKCIFLGLPNTLENKQEAFKVLERVNFHIKHNEFDYSLEKYISVTSTRKSSSKLKNQDASDTCIINIKFSLLDIYIKYINYKKIYIKNNTYIYLTETIQKHIQKLDTEGITEPSDALKVREHLLINTTRDMARRVLMAISSMYKWAIKNNLLNAPNPYQDMATELKTNQEYKPNPFTQEEKTKILEAFTDEYWYTRYPGKRNQYAYYLPFIEFLFLTGCRPSEAVGLRWCDVSESEINFRGSITFAKGKAIRNEGSKNNKCRRFPVNAKLRELLDGQKRPSSDSPDDLVFPSPSGKPINYNNFSKRAWAKMVDPIKDGTTPYCARDTFITEQIAKGIPIAVIAKWVDNSSQIIEKHYLGDAGLKDIVPL
jgi:integrase